MAEWSGRPAYRQLAYDLRSQITDGRLPVGSTLPSVADLMKQHGVSITVVRAAVRELKAEGLITTHQGKGTFVGSATPVAPAPADQLPPEFRTIMERLDAVCDDLRAMNERLAQVEAIVKPEEQRGKRPRRSGA